MLQDIECGPKSERPEDFLQSPASVTAIVIVPELPVGRQAADPRDCGADLIRVDVEHAGLAELVHPGNAQIRHESRIEAKVSTSPEWHASSETAHGGRWKLYQSVRQFVDVRFCPFYPVDIVDPDRIDTRVITKIALLEYVQRPQGRPGNGKVWSSESVNRFPGDILKIVFGKLHLLLKLVPAHAKDPDVVVAVTGNFMARLGDLLDDMGKVSGYSSQKKEGGLHIKLMQNVQHGVHICFDFEVFFRLISVLSGDGEALEI